MKEIIKLILKYHFTIIFILLEIVSFTLIVQHNSYQKTVFSKYTASFFSYISSLVSEVDDYFSLRNINEHLVEENANLKNTIENLKGYIVQSGMDTVMIHHAIPYDVTYVYQSAKVVNASFNKTKNYLTLDKGYTDGLRKEMAVCSRDGVVGIVQNTSNHNAVVLPLINTNMRTSVKLKKNGYYGSLQWNGDDYRFSYLKDIPFHVDAMQGDTVVTSGFSSIFPEGELIGFVESVDKETANFLTVKVKLAVDFRKIYDVYIINNKKKEGQKRLEATTNE